MESVRKKIINRALTRDHQELLPPTPSYSYFPPDISQLEVYFQHLLHFAKQGMEFPPPLIHKSSSMSALLERCLQELPDFSLQFYVQARHILKRIPLLESKQEIFSFSVLLRDFLDRSDSKPLNLPIVNQIQSQANRIDSKTITEFSIRIQDEEPYKSLCLAFLIFYLRDEPSISQAFYDPVAFVKEYLKNPACALDRIHNTVLYLKGANSAITEYSPFNGKISDLSTKQIYDLFDLILRYFQETELQTTGRFEGISDTVELQYARPEHSDFDCSTVIADELFQSSIFEFDTTAIHASPIQTASPSSSISSTKHQFTNCNYSRTPNSPRSLNTPKSMHSPTSHGVGSLEAKSIDQNNEAREKFKSFLIDTKKKNPSINFLAHKHTLIAKFASEASWNDKRAAKAFKEENQFRAIVTEVNKQHKQILNRPKHDRLAAILCKYNK